MKSKQIKQEKIEEEDELLNGFEQFCQKEIEIKQLYI